MIYKYFDMGKYKLIFFWSKNPLEVSEEFIRNYNSSQDLEDREKYEVTAHKMLERAKVEYHCAIKMVKLFKLVYDIGAKFQIFLTFYFCFRGELAFENVALVLMSIFLWLGLS